MIKFFRNIRQQLLTKNKFSNYLLYAIGEIILVVVGILIALQINNLNEERKLNLELKQFKISLISDLKKDLISISKELDLLINDTKKLNNYFKRMSREDITIDTLIKIYSSEFNPTIYGSITFNNSTMNSLNSTGNFSNLEHWIQKDLVEISEFKENYFTILSDAVSYVQLILLDTHNYPFNVKALVRNSKLYNEIWKYANLSELGAFMNNLFGLKKLLEKEAIEKLQLIQNKTNLILQKLNTK